MKKYNLVISVIPVVIIASFLAVYFLPQLEVEASIQSDNGQKIAKITRPNPSNIYDEDMESILAQLSSDVSKQEFKCLSQAVYFEARSEPFEGQVAVAYVILNRVKDKRYPNTICGVVFQNEKRRHSCQFSFACDGLSDNPYEMTAWNQARRVAGGALENALSDVTASSTHYHAIYVHPKWAKMMQPTIAVGHHIFYREEL